MKTNLLRCVNTPDVALPDCQEVSDDIAKITNGSGLLRGNAFWTKYFARNLEDPQRDFIILNGKQFRKIQNYFDAEGFDYSIGDKDISLCCEKSTKKMNVLSADFELNNGKVFKPSFINPRQKLSLLDVRAYFDTF